MDSGANSFVTHKRKYLHRFARRKIKVDLALGFQACFEGTGIMLCSAPEAPGFIFALYPTFLATTDTCTTVTNGGFKKFCGFKDVIINTWQSIYFLHSSGAEFTLPLHERNSIDYIKFHIHPSTSQSKSITIGDRPLYSHMSLQPVATHHRSLIGSVELSWRLHIQYAHRSISILQQMVKAGYIDGVAKSTTLADLPFRCPICDASGATLKRRGRLEDTSKLPVGTRFHIDFTFWNKVSIRGFHASLTIVEATSRNLWFFPCRHKNPPIDLCLFFFGWLRRHGVPVLQIRCDEDGAFIRSTEFCKMMLDSLGVAIQSTGGYASTINGKAESPQKTQKNQVRAMLMGANQGDEFHCFCGQYGAFVHNNVINRITGKPPALEFTGKLVSHKSIFPWGARCKIIKQLPAQRALSPRTSGDPRVAASGSILSSNDDDTSAFDGIFMGWSGGSPTVALVYKPGDKSHKIRRAHHIIVDMHAMSHNPSVDQLRPNESILRQCAALRHDQIMSSAGKVARMAPPAEWKLRPDPVPELTLDTVGSLFPPADTETLEITLPPKGTALGITLGTDEDALAPIIVRIDPGVPLYEQIPLKHHFARSWIIQIHNEQPLTGAGAKDAFESLQLQGKDRLISLTLCKIDNPKRFDYENYRSVFDSCTGLMAAHMVVLPYKPTAPKSFYDGCLHGPEKEHWREACFHQFDKNQRVGLFSQPVPIESVPKGIKVHQTVLAPKVKKTDAADTYKFVTRMCCNGSRMEKGIDFDHSWSPTIGAGPFRLTIHSAAAWSLTLAIMDVENCFQNTLLVEKEKVVVTIPPYYMEWFAREFPSYRIDNSPSGKYVLQALKGLQGDRKIGRKWYLLLKQLLCAFGCIQCLDEPALYKYGPDSDGYLLLVNTSTDDFLCAFSDEVIFRRLYDYLKAHFGITICTGTHLEYLNLRIIQTKYGISYDQTEHINDEILTAYFSNDSDERYKSVHTPFRTDNVYERELAEQLPATPSQLLALEKKYKGSFPSIIGKLMHVFCWTRFDIGYAMTRLSKFIQTPSEAAFAGLYRALRYLWTHKHRPIIAPRRVIEGYHTLRVNFDRDKFEEIRIPNTLTIVVDSDHARDNSNRRSCECIFILLNGVAFDWKMNQQRVIALHSTDSETRCVFSAVKRGLFIQNVAQFIGIPLDDLRPTQIFEDSQPCIDICEANQVTSRVKHIAVPIHFIHEFIHRNRFKMVKIGTHLNVADSGTKPNPSPTHFRHFDYACGVRFYPPHGSEHFKLLALDDFVPSPFEPPTHSSLEG